MQAGQALAVVVDHRAADRQLPVSGLEDLDQARLARPVDQRTCGHLPETALSALARSSGDPVVVRMAIQPEDDVAEAQEQLDQLARVLLATRIGQAVKAVVGQHHDVMVRVGSPDDGAVASCEGRVNLFESLLEPVQLGRSDGSIGSAGIAHGVQRDEADDPRVMHVVRELVVDVPWAEAMAAAAHMRVDELASRDRTSLGVRRHLDRLTRHERLWIVGEGFHGAVGIQAGWRADRFAARCHRRFQSGRDDANPLAHLLVVAVATEPGNA